MAKVSIIMGVYNCENREELEQSVYSIINQTFKDWEFIICNDGSTNSTLNILKRFESIDRRIKVVSYEKNKGLAYALNYAYKNSSGKYIARQDADDISYPDRLMKEVKFLDDNLEYDLVGTFADVYDDNGIWGTFSVPEKPSKRDFLWSSPFLHPSIMIRGNSFEKAGCYRIAWETRRAEDYDLFMSMYANGCLGYNIQEKLYKYKIVNKYTKHRAMKDRLEEAVVRIKGFRKLNILLRGIPFICKPIIIGILPQCIFRKIRQKQY